MLNKQKCKALNRRNNPCKSKVYKSGFCRNHYHWFTNKHPRLKLQGNSNKKVRLFKQKPLKAKDYKKYIDSSKWQKFSRRIRKKMTCCQQCGSFRYLHVHHLSYQNLGIETEDDVTVLCQRCHDDFHSKHTYNSKYHQFERNK